MNFASQNALRVYLYDCTPLTTKKPAINWLCVSTYSFQKLSFPPICRIHTAQNPYVSQVDLFMEFSVSCTSHPLQNPATAQALSWPDTRHRFFQPLPAPSNKAASLPIFAKLLTEPYTPTSQEQTESGVVAEVAWFQEHSHFTRHKKYLPLAGILK